jgi:SAM-dependent methyltransferase
LSYSRFAPLAFLGGVLLELSLESWRALTKRQRPKGLLSWDAAPGTCPICKRRTLFVKSELWLRESNSCLSCGSISRWRAFYSVLETRFPRWRAMRIHEASPCGPGSELIRRECSGYVCSAYSTGKTPPGIRRESLGEQSFEDESFDLVLTQDVLEHVADPESALKEIARTLKPGGAHLFTVPWNRSAKTESRAVSRSGVVEHLKDPIYHGDPYDPKGSLVYTDWGADLVEFIERACGMTTEVVSLNDPRNGTDVEMADVFVSRKNSPAPREILR